MDEDIGTISRKALLILAKAYHDHQVHTMVTSVPLFPKDLADYLSASALYTIAIQALRDGHKAKASELTSLTFLRGILDATWGSDGANPAKEAAEEIIKLSEKMGALEDELEKVKGERDYFKQIYKDAMKAARCLDPRQSLVEAIRDLVGNAEARSYQ